MFERNSFNMDKNAITVLFRDVNGKRFYKNYNTPADFVSTDFSWFDEHNYEILFVTWGNHCIYNALKNEPITLEELIGFFA